MAGPQSTQSVVPERKELSDTIRFVLKDLHGSVDAAVVAKKIKAERPTWIIQERRVKKFMKRFIKERGLNLPKTDDRYTPSDMKSSPIKFSSPRSTSSISSKTDTTVTSPYSIQEFDIIEEGHSRIEEEKSGTVEEKKNESPYSARELDIAEEGYSETKTVEGKNVTKGKNLNIKNIYEADNEDNDSSDDCCVACAIM